MANRQIFEPIEEPDQWAVAAYLIAISPELQSGAKVRREEQRRAAESLQAVRVALVSPADRSDRDLGAARALVEETCTMCHELTEVENYPLHSEQDVAELLERMVENGLDVTEEDSETIAWYLTRTYME
jgi:cytochrome c5